MPYGVRRCRLLLFWLSMLFDLFVMMVTVHSWSTSGDCLPANRRRAYGEPSIVSTEGHHHRRRPAPEGWACRRVLPRTCLPGTDCWLQRLPPRLLFSSLPAAAAARTARAHAGRRRWSILGRTCRLHLPAGSSSTSGCLGRRRRASSNSAGSSVEQLLSCLLAATCHLP